MLHINRRHALAGLAASAVSGRAMAQPSTFTTNMYGGRWENTWREKVLPPFAKTIGRSVTLDQQLSELDALLEAAVSRGRTRPAARCECGAPVFWGSRFCPQCGRPVGAAAPTGETT